jgi:hypothetical protein
MASDDAPEAGTFRAAAWGFGLFGTIGFLLASALGAALVSNVNDPSSSGGGWGIAIVILGAGAAVLTCAFFSGLAGAALGALRWSESSSMLIRYGWPIAILPLIPIVAATKFVHEAQAESKHLQARADAFQPGKRQSSQGDTAAPPPGEHLSQSAAELPPSLAECIYPGSQVEFVAPRPPDFVTNVTVTPPLGSTFAAVREWYSARARDPQENERTWLARLSLPAALPPYDVYVVRKPAEPTVVQVVMIKRAVQGG